jgi:AcrR family transcriptional regulator
MGGTPENKETGCYQSALSADLQSMQEFRIPDGGLRETKKRRTRQAIRAAAITLFTDQGVEATTVEQIAMAADISPRTFFNYFDTKEQAVSLPYGLRDEVSIGKPVKVGSEWTAIETACLALADALESDADERETLLAGIRLCQVEPTLRDQASAQRGRWEQLLLSPLKPTLTNRVIVNAAAGAVWASLTDWAVSNGEGSLHERINNALKLIHC